MSVGSLSATDLSCGPAGDFSERPVLAPRIYNLLHIQVGHMDLRPLGVAHLDLVLETVLVDEEVSDLFVVDLKE